MITSYRYNKKTCKLKITKKNHKKINYNSVAAGIFPFSHHNGNIYLLCGKESTGYEKNKYADFGGHYEIEDKNIFDTAVRETYEESMGFIGTKNELYKKIKRSKINMSSSQKYYCFIMRVKYDNNLPKVYKNVYAYFLECTNKKKILPTCPEGYMEKSEVKWFKLDKIKQILKNKKKANKIFRKEFINTLENTVAFFDYIKFEK